MDSLSCIDEKSEFVLLIDIGCQYNRVLERRLNYFGVSFKKLLFKKDLIPDSSFSFFNYKAVIISGSYFSASEFSKTNFFHWIKEQIQSGFHNTPIMGICAGMLLIHYISNGQISKYLGACYGPIEVSRVRNHPLLKDFPFKFRGWASFEESVSKLGLGYYSLATSGKQHLISAHASKTIFTIQYHPELSESEFGEQLIRNFLAISKVNLKTQTFADFTTDLELQLENLKAEYSKKLEGKKILVVVSGDLSSSILIHFLKLIVNHPEDIYPVYISTGLQLKNHEEEIIKYFLLKFANFKLINWKSSIFEELKGVDNAEYKRKIISEKYWESIKAYIYSLKEKGVSVFAQATTRTDRVEDNEDNENILEYHSLCNSYIPKDLELIEPFFKLFKDEVRKLGFVLNLPTFLLSKQPLPILGLANRIIGEVTWEKVELLGEIHNFLEKEFQMRKLEKYSDQYFPILLSDKSAGIKENRRFSGYSIVLRAIKTKDFMSAHVSYISISELISLGNKLVSSFPLVSRVLYDLTTKPASTIEWE